MISSGGLHVESDRDGGEQYLKLYHFSDGQIILVKELLTSHEAEVACLSRGGSLAQISTPYITEYATKTLMFHDYDRAWSLSTKKSG